MKINGEEARLALLSITLKRARFEAESLEFCGKHAIVNEIEALQNKVKDILLTFAKEGAHEHKIKFSKLVSDKCCFRQPL